ncbi:MAG: bifunctional folylpolyglutamate synthase/dihydrofolate synthase [Syntrophobacterales bacterium]|nr:bifunctional folylpolyglutamate synthase/dihydrofolate synthase [Syntrophobacterales bacterium]
MQSPLQYLEGLKQRGINLGIGPISGLLARLDNPQIKYKTILIGGTNGKGSTAAILSSILMKEGMNVGLYTSPHICDFRERIRINGRMIPEDALCTLIDKVREEIKEDVTYFEFSTALAFLYFSQCEADIAVVEVGMGGRLDATNLVSPEVSVITNISLEHQRYLGDNLESIACEKGGIIKENGICVTAAKGRKVIDTLEEICSQRKSVFYRTGRDIRVRRSGKGSFSYYGINKHYSGLRNSLVGGHQIENAALALAVVDILTVKGMEINDNSVTEGLRDVKWEGRLELVSRNPGIVVDGAHNPAGISSLCSSLLADFSYRRLIMVFGVLRDKDYAEMLKKIMPLADRIILTSPKEERAARTEDLLSVTSPYHDHVEAIDDSVEALVRARFLAGVDDLVCVTGSLYLVGEIKKHLRFDLPEDRLL